MGSRHAQITSATLKEVANGLRDIASRIGISYGPDTPHYDSRGRRRRLPPTPADFYRTIDHSRFDSAIRWLSLAVSSHDAAELKGRVYSLKRRYHKAHFTACLLLNNDPLDSKETAEINYALPILSDLHNRILRDRFPDYEVEPDVDDLQPDLRLSHAILDEYHTLREDLPSAAMALIDTAAILLGREIEEDGPAGVGQWRYNGKLFTGMGDTQWRFAKALWESPNRTQPLSTLANATKGFEVVPEESTAKGWASRASKFFTEKAIPLKVTGSKGTFSLVAINS